MLILILKRYKTNMNCIHVYNKYFKQTNKGNDEIYI